MALEGLRKGAAIAARLAKKAKSRSLGISFPVWNNSQSLTAQALSEGAITQRLVKIAALSPNPTKPRLS